MFAWHLDKARSLARKLKVAEPHEMNLASSTVPERELARGLNLQTVIQLFTTTTMAHQADAKSMLDSRGLYEGATVHGVNPLLLVEKIIRYTSRAQPPWITR